MWPNFSNIKNIPFILKSIFKWHNLNTESPSSWVTFSNMFKQVLCVMIRISNFHFISFFSSKIFNSSISLKMHFNPESFILFVYPFECMRGVTIKVSITIRCTSITKKNRNLVNRFRSKRKEIPKHISIL